MDRLEFGANFRAFAEAAKLQTPLRLLLLAWVDLNWKSVSKLDPGKIREFLNLAHEHIVADHVARQTLMNCVKRTRGVEVPFVVVERINNHIRTAYSQVAGDDVATFERLIAPLRFDERDGGPSSSAVR